MQDDAQRRGISHAVGVESRKTVSGHGVVSSSVYACWPKLPVLLPCPFCGGEASMNIGGFGERFVTCSDDNCGGRMGCGIWAANEIVASELWNRRTESKLVDKLNDSSL